MTIRARCPNPDCGAIHELADEKAGEKVKCTKCKTIFTVEAMESSLSAGKPSNPSGGQSNGGAAKRKNLKLIAVLGILAVVVIIAAFYFYQNMTGKEPAPEKLGPRPDSKAKEEKAPAPAAASITAAPAEVPFLPKLVGYLPKDCVGFCHVDISLLNKQLPSAEGEAGEKRSILEAAIENALLGIKADEEEAGALLEEGWARLKNANVGIAFLGVQTGVGVSPKLLACISEEEGLREFVENSLKKKIEEETGKTFAEREVSGTKLYSMLVDEMGIEVGYAWHEGTLAVGAPSSVVEAAFTGTSEPLAASSAYGELKGLFESPGCFKGYIDIKRLAEELHTLPEPTRTQFAQLFPAQKMEYLPAAAAMLSMGDGFRIHAWTRNPDKVLEELPSWSGKLAVSDYDLIGRIPGEMTIAGVMRLGDLQEVWNFMSKTGDMERLKQIFAPLARARAAARKAACMSNLKQIGLGIHMYAQGNEEKLPEKIEDLVPSYIVDAKVLWCPDSKKKQEGKETNYILNKEVTSIGERPGTPLAWDDPEEDRHKGSLNVLFLDGHVEPMPAAKLQALLKGEEPPAGLDAPEPEKEASDIFAGLDAEKLMASVGNEAAFALRPVSPTASSGQPGVEVLFLMKVKDSQIRDALESVLSSMGMEVHRRTEAGIEYSGAGFKDWTRPPFGFAQRDDLFVVASTLDVLERALETSAEGSFEKDPSYALALSKMPFKKTSAIYVVSDRLWSDVVPPMMADQINFGTISLAQVMEDNISKGEIWIEKEQGLFNIFRMMFAPFGIGRARAAPRASACQNNLKQIGLGVYMYAQDHQEKVPERLEDLVPNYIVEPKTLWCPDSKKEQTGTETNYVYNTKIESIGDVPTKPLAWDDPEEDRHNGVVNVLYLDGHVEEVPISRLRVLLESESLSE